MWAELLETGSALGAVAVGVNQAADCGMVAGLELGDCGANLGDTANESHVRERMDRQWAPCSIRYGLGGDQSGICHRKGFQPECSDRLDCVAG